MSEKMQSPLAPKENEQVLTGWGRTSPSTAVLVPATSVDRVQELVRNASERGVLARGLGRSYGDAAQSGGAHVLDMTTAAHFTLDAERAEVTAQAGASLDAIIASIVPQGFFVPVTPGTRMVTVGGAIAADVHGKNHHVEGSFGQHVVSMDVIVGDGSVVTLRPDDPATAERFWATVGGMGLTGIITSATFRVLPIETSWISVDIERAKDLDDVMARMISGDDAYRYSVAWIDTVSASGRGVLTRGDHATKAQLAAAKPRLSSNPLEYSGKVVATAPPIFPSKTLNPLTVRAFNEVWYRKHPKFKQGALEQIAPFFHPLDFVQEWTRVYGPQGFLQYQFVVPDSASEVVRTALSKLREVGAPSFLTVLKRFGASNPAPLSFPQPGWTLAADIPTGVPGLGRVLDELDDLVASEGGRLYFAKDSRQAPEMVRRTYPRLAEWQSVRATMDPRGVFTSDLGRRLGL